MSINANYSAPNCVLTINGRQVTAYASDSAVSISEATERSTLQQGADGNAIRYDVVNPQYTMTLALLPGSGDSSFLTGLAANRSVEISAVYVTLSTLETVTLTEGVLRNIGDIVRGGPTVSDDTFIFDFNVGVITLGA